MDLVIYKILFKFLKIVKAYSKEKIDFLLLICK